MGRACRSTLWSLTAVKLLETMAMGDDAWNRRDSTAEIRIGPRHYPTDLRFMVLMLFALFVWSMITAFTAIRYGDLQTAVVGESLEQMQREVEEHAKAVDEYDERLQNIVFEYGTVYVRWGQVFCGSESILIYRGNYLCTYLPS